MVYHLVMRTYPKTFRKENPDKFCACCIQETQSQELFLVAFSSTRASTNPQELLVLAATREHQLKRKYKYN
jgi:hypothetical protein